MACTQEAPLFREVAESSPQAELTFVNIRETGGWSNDAAAAGPKAAALIAAAQEDMPPISLVTLESSGVALIYGRDEIAIEAAQRLADRLDITVLLTKPGDVTPRRTNEFPVLKGTIRNARGHLGAFELAIDDYALPLPSSRAKLVFGPSRNGATSTCDLILDLSGGTPLFPAHELRPGYLRADPRDRAAVERAIAEAGGLVGTFDKPRFIQFEASLCAHSRSGITGCTRCLDLCPTGAITPDGNAVAIDANVCAGCGSCASVCPTGAASYSLPSADALMRRLRTLLQTYRKAGGSDAIVLFHDGEHGDDLIDALARFGAGLPANVLPLRVNEVTQLGPENIAAVFAYGGSGVAMLTRAKPKHDIAGLRRAVEMSDTIVCGARLRRRPGADHRDRRSRPVARHARRLARRRRDAKAGRLRAARRQARRARNHVPRTASRRARAGRCRAAAAGRAVRRRQSRMSKAARSAMPASPPARRMRCRTIPIAPCCALPKASACNAGCANPPVPKMSSRWSRGSISRRGTRRSRVLKEEEPFLCIACGKPFGTKSSIDRVLAKLGEKHWMFQGANARRLDVIKMCADCRVEAVVNEGFDPHGAPQRPPVMTTEDYLRARDAKKGDPLGS